MKATKIIATAKNGRTKEFFIHEDGKTISDCAWWMVSNSSTVGSYNAERNVIEFTGAERWIAVEMWLAPGQWSKIGDKLSQTIEVRDIEVIQN